MAFALHPFIYVIVKEDILNGELNRVLQEVRDYCSNLKNEEATKNTEYKKNLLQLLDNKYQIL